MSSTATSPAASLPPPTPTPPPDHAVAARVASPPPASDAAPPPAASSGAPVNCAAAVGAPLSCGRDRAPQPVAPTATPAQVPRDGDGDGNGNGDSDSTHAAFAHLNLSSDAPLRAAARVQCPGPCGKRRRYYCSDCVLALVDAPRVALPVHVHVVQAAAEVPQRSTAQQVAVLAPAHATVWRPFPECGDQLLDTVVRPAKPGTVAVLYPGDDAKTPAQAAFELPDLAHVIVVDASWPKSVLLMQTPWLRALPRVTLPSASELELQGGGGDDAGRTRFWRYAPVRGAGSETFSADKVGALASTAESVHRFCDALGRARGAPRGACDDLLWLFAFQYGRVKAVYEQAPGKRERIMRKSKGLLHHL